MTLSELEDLAQKLRERRDEINKAEGEHALLQRELQHSKNLLTDTQSMLELENASMQTIRNRIAELKQEQNSLEQHVRHYKEQTMKEEGKLRATKSTATDQLRLLQIDLTKMQNEFKAQQKALEELERHRRSVEEENELRRREAQTKLETTGREYEEEMRKLQNTKSEMRVQRLELEQLTSKRRQLESELGHIKEQISAETGRYDTEELEAKRRLEQSEKQLAEAEKKLRTVKEKVAAYEGEQVRAAAPSTCISPAIP